MAFLDKTGLARLWTNILALADTKVPTSRTVNGKPLSDDITLSASDVGADSAGSASAALGSANSYTDLQIKNHGHPTDTSRASQAEFDEHISNHAPADAEKNQNAFSNIKVGSTTVAADSATDTVEFVGSNVTITPDATNDKVTFAVPTAGSSLGLVKSGGDVSISDGVITVNTAASADKIQYVSINKAPEGDGCYPVTINTPFTIDSVTFPQWAKGMFISTGTSDATLYVIDMAGTTYTAFRNSGKWQNAKVLISNTGGTINGKLILQGDNPLEMYEATGWHLDKYGNIIAKTTSETAYWAMFNQDKTKELFKVFWKSGDAATLGDLTVGGTITGTLDGNATSATKATSLSNSDSITTPDTGSGWTRPTSANVAVKGDGGVYAFKATSAMTEGKPASDGHILHFEWDNTYGYTSQLALPTSSGSMQYRQMEGGTWHDWVSVIDSSTIGSQSVASATKATQDASGNTITSTYATKTELNNLDKTLSNAIDNGLAEKADKRQLQYITVTSARSLTIQDDTTYFLVNDDNHHITFNPVDTKINATVWIYTDSDKPDFSVPTTWTEESYTYGTQKTTYLTRITFCGGVYVPELCSGY